MQNTPVQVEPTGIKSQSAKDILLKFGKIKDEFNSAFLALQEEHKTRISLSANEKGILGAIINYDDIGGS